MNNFHKTRGFELALAVAALCTVTSGPAWALVGLPGPDSGVVAGVAIVGALVVAKMWRRK